MGNCSTVAPRGPTPVLIMSIHVSNMKLEFGDCHKGQNRCLGVTAKNGKTVGTTVSRLKLLLRIP